ncbi:MAG: hypothetical protein QF368_20150 [SAR202 cluster bacterium]|nr:hypothetical protein [SAR202 cluster bacterium]
MDPGFYLKLVNEAYRDELRAPLTLRTITDANPRIVSRLQTHFEAEGIAGGKFDPYRPAAYLLQNHNTLIGEINDNTIDGVAAMFERINALLPTNGAVAGKQLDVARSRMLAMAPQNQN